MKAHLPLWSFACSYFFIYSSLGGIGPYFPLYLESLGISPEHIGLILGLSMLGRVVIPFLIGWLSDTTGRSILYTRLSALGCILVFAALCVSEVSAVSIAVLMFLFCSFWGALAPLLDAQTLNQLGQQKHLYSKIRAWGSIGFIITALCLGYSIENLGIGILLPALLLVSVLTLLFVYQLPAAETKSNIEVTGGFWKRVKQNQVVLLLLIAFLMLASHGPYYTFFSLYLEEHGYSRTMIGALWSFAIVSEVIFFWFLPKLLLRVSAAPVLFFCVLLTIVRWLLIAFAIDSLASVLFAQLLHAASYAGHHAAIVSLISLYFTGSHASRGQALYNSVGFGLGVTVGITLSGYLWAVWGGEGTYLFSALTAFTALALAAFVMLNQKEVKVNANIQS